ncbi:MAG: THUMP domain-containing protein [Pseudomonadota bacterium]
MFYYDYQKHNVYFAKCANLAEPILEEELLELGAYETNQAFKGVYFKAEKETFYKILYLSRISSRILAPLISFNCHNEKQLYKKCHEIDWSKIFGVSKTFACFATVANSKMRNSQFASLKLKDAIVDRFNKDLGKRPNVDPKSPDIWINLNISNNKASISLDASGGSLDKRGYRKTTVEAPCGETLAATILRIIKFDENQSLYDPMCGSGTFLAEALMKIANVPNLYNREKIGISLFPDFDKDLWDNVKNECDKRVYLKDPNCIQGSDISKSSVAAAKSNLENIPHGKKVIIKIADFNNLDGLKDKVIVLNPPYGGRIGDKSKLKELYSEFGDFLKQKCQNSTCYMLIGDLELIKSIGLRTSFKKPIYNGGLECRLVKLDIY